mmetsp:Transcript_5484/g.15739  ORF Transcript_5484/g.15739 Transcript_5484/m.15739 type:complete len:103 (-) Transcript_5484:434-742(-)
MTICEVVHLHTIMVPTLERCSGRFKRSDNGVKKYLEWFGDQESVTLPDVLQSFDSGLTDLLQERLLVCDPSKRKSAADCLSSPYILGRPSLVLPNAGRGRLV